MNDIYSLVRLCNSSNNPNNYSFSDYLYSPVSRLEVYIMFISYGISYIFLYGRYHK